MQAMSCNYTVQSHVDNCKNRKYYSVIDAVVIIISIVIQYILLYHCWHYDTLLSFTQLQPRGR